MPKNVGGGKKFKKRKSKIPAGPGKLLYPDPDQLYGIVLNRLGNGWVKLVVCDVYGAGVRTVLGRIRGVLRKRRVPFIEGSYVIACGREFENASTEKPKVDVIHKYYDDHVRLLLKENRIPPEMKALYDSMTGITEAKMGRKDDTCPTEKDVEDMFASEDGGFTFEDIDDI